MKVFISYRRADSQATAGRISQFLGGVAAVKAVFLDVEGISVGDDFERRIAAVLAEASHVFVLIGTAWCGPRSAMERVRIFDADDMVRMEVRQALAGRRHVVPVLIDGVAMPRPSDMPEDLAALVKLNAFALRNAHFDADMDMLLDDLMGTRRARGSRWHQARLTRSGIALRFLGGVVAGSVLLILLGLANRLGGIDCADLTCSLMRLFGIADESDGLFLMWVLAAATLLLGGFSPFALRWWRSPR